MSRPLIRKSKQELSKIICSLREQNCSWGTIASFLNGRHIRRVGNDAIWTADTVRKFQARIDGKRHNSGGRPHKRPKTRAECAHIERPCPWATCRHHMASLYIRTNRHDTRPQTELSLAIEDGDFSAMPYTCVLDLVEERSAITNLELAGLMDVSRNQVYRVVQQALAKAQSTGGEAGEFLRKAYEYSRTIKAGEWEDNEQ